MSTGPFDSRRRRHRCDACFRSHLKCSGHSPCTSCAKRNHLCRYSLVVSARRTDIRVDRGKQQTLSTFRLVGRSHVAETKITKPPKADPAVFYFFHYDIFMQRNKFTGLKSPQQEVKGLMKLADSETYLRDAMLALGAMQALKLCQASKAKEIHQVALESYARAIVGLRGALGNRINNVQFRAMILWTTLLLGLFELMNDSTGNGWLQHLVHGTAQALVASGPSTFLSGSCSKFFTECKVFEVCRAIIFNQPSFLAEDEWLSLSTSLRAKSTSGSQQALDELLDIVVMCASLRVRAANFVETLRSTPETLDTTKDAQAISSQGFTLRHQLRCWASANHTFGIFRASMISQASPQDSLPSNIGPEPQLRLLAETFFSAISIYLSGVFDYEICDWQSLNMAVPTLPEDEIQQHVESILALSQQLATTDFSPLLLLFPLRVASARARQPGQRQQIMSLLGLIKSSFAVAGAFMEDIESLWGYNSIA